MCKKLTKRCLDLQNGHHAAFRLSLMCQKTWRRGKTADIRRFCSGFHFNHDRLCVACKDLSEFSDQVSPLGAESLEPRLFNGDFMRI